MSTFLQAGDNDLLLTNGRLTLVRNNTDEAAIKLKNLFQFFEGEWFLDTRLGFPFYRYVLIKNPDFGVVRQLFRKVILRPQAIKEVLDLNVTLDGRTREAAFTFRARTNDGQIIVGGSGDPYIVVTKEAA